MTSFEDAEDLRAHEVTRIAQVYRISGRAVIAAGLDAEQAFVQNLRASLVQKHGDAWSEAFATQITEVTDEAKAKAATWMAEDAAAQAATLAQEAEMVVAALSPDLVPASELEEMAAAASSPDLVSEADLKSLAAAAIAADRDAAASAAT